MQTFSNGKRRFYYFLCDTQKKSRGKNAYDHSTTQEIIKVREWIPHIHAGPPTKVIPLKLFLDIVPSSSANITRALLEQPKRLSRNYMRRNGGNVIVYVLISFHSRDVPCTFSRFSVRPGFSLFCSRLAVHYLAVYSILRSNFNYSLKLNKSSLRAAATSIMAM